MSDETTVAPEATETEAAPEASTRRFPPLPRGSAAGC